MEISNCVLFKELPKLLQSYDLVIFANETENGKNQTIKNAINKLKQNLNDKALNIAYIVGSEGGFSSDEIELLTSIENVVSVSLGKRILRTETASISLASILTYELENF